MRFFNFLKMDRHVSILREISKFVAGMVATDFLVGAWLFFDNLLPMNVLGMPISPSAAVGGMIFDILLMLLLVHYGWHASIVAPKKPKTLLRVVGVLLGVVAVLHLLRLVLGLDIVIAGWNAPLWLSGIGAIVTAYLSYASFTFAQHK